MPSEARAPLCSENETIDTCPDNPAGAVRQHDFILRVRAALVAGSAGRCKRQIEMVMAVIAAVRHDMAAAQQMEVRELGIVRLVLEHEGKQRTIRSAFEQRWSIGIQD